jgi:hypothetical protein
MGDPRTKHATLEAFCADAFDWRRPVEWFGKTGIAPLAEYEDPRIARLDLVTAGTHETYVGFDVTILDRRTGPISKVRLSFRDALDLAEKPTVAAPRDKATCDSSWTVTGSNRTGWSMRPWGPDDTTEIVERFEQLVALFELPE